MREVHQFLQDQKNIHSSKRKHGFYTWSTDAALFTSFSIYIAPKFI